MYVSTKNRALETANIIKEVLGYNIEIKVDERLIEQST
jgi:broad specificity phosphatase PhoE